MPVSSAEPVAPRLARRARPRFRPDVATTRAAAAVLWAVAYLLALHGQRVLTGSGIPVLPGLLIAFGAWALASGLLQLAGAWRAGEPRRVQLPLIISGAVSAIAGVFFAATAAQLSDLGGYAVLGAVFFVAWTFVNRAGTRSR